MYPTQSPPLVLELGRAKEKIIIVFLGWRALNDDFDEAMVRELVWFLPCPARCSSRDAREFEQKPPLGAWRIIDFLESVEAEGALGRLTTELQQE